uniref:Uncharacterized protein n=1 Tax=Phlebotomus papatasi TaxID=29031 RepID=A0A1B0DR25_PHLPP
MIFVRSKWSSISLVCFLLAFTAFPGCVSGAKSKSGGDAPKVQAPVDPVIEEVTAKQLERILQEKDYVAVYWCKCVICDHFVPWHTLNGSHFGLIPEQRKVSRKPVKKSLKCS